MFEFRRQISHVVFGYLLLVVGVLWGKHSLALLLSIALFFGLIVLNAHLRGFRDPLIEWILENFERSSAEIPGKGALFYVVGCLFLVTFSPDYYFALAIIAVLAFADGAATMVGSRGMHALHWNPKKSWEGLAAFVFVGFIVASFFVGFSTALVYSVLLAFVEAVDAPIDDNLVIPVVAIILRFAGI